MGFQRAQWHSGLTYQQTCEHCKIVLQYTDYSLDFRPWYADGYVDCPRCKSHLRHDEKYAINAPQAQPQQVVVPEPAPVAAEGEPVAAPVAEEPAVEVVVEETIVETPVVEIPAPVVEASTAPVAFCTKCGRAYGKGDRFCAQCGNKR